MDAPGTSAPLVFGTRLLALEAAALRRHLTSLFAAGSSSGTVAVDTFFFLVDAVSELPRDDAPRARQDHVVLDLQRLVIFRDGGAAATPGIASLIHHMIDGYTLQPFERFAEFEREQAYRFAFDLAALDLVPRLLAELGSGEYATCDLLTGELFRARLNHHPRAGARPRLVSPREPVGSPLRPVTVPRTLRSGPPPQLDDFVEDAAGVIRCAFVGENFASLPCANTLVTANRGRKREFCFGIAVSPARARAIASCEAAERFQIGRQPAGTELVRGSYRELADVAVDPRELFLGRSPECPEDDGQPFDPGMPICWTWAWGPADGRSRLVPAQEIWFDTPQVMSEPRLSVSTTSGCALGATVEEAAVFGMLEAIERDGFLTSWYLRRPATEIAIESIRSEELHDLLSRLGFVLPGYRVVLFDLTTDVGIPTIGTLGMKVSGNGPRVLAAGAAHLDAEQACLRAVMELVRFRFWPKLTPELAAEIRARTTVAVSPDAHFDFYAIDDNFAAFDYLELGRRRPIDVQEIGTESPIDIGQTARLDLVLQAVAKRLEDVGAHLYIKDITHPTFAECGMRIARAVTPGLYPMWFGGRSRRFAVTDRLRRLAERCTGLPFDRRRLQLAPHPMC